MAKLAWRLTPIDPQKDFAPKEMAQILSRVEDGKTDKAWLKPTFIKTQIQKLRIRSLMLNLLGIFSLIALVFAIQSSYVHIGEFIPFTLAEAQTPDQVLRAGLLDLKMSGAEGSLQVAEMFAECHGFQLALFANLTSEVNIKIDDSDFATQIADQAIIDGHMAFLSAVDHTPDPEEYVNKISDAERARWKDLKNKPGETDLRVWKRLMLCQKIAPMSQYFVKEIRRKKNVSDSE